MQNVPGFSGVVDLHAVVGKVAPRAHAYEEGTSGIVVDYVPRVVPHHLAAALEEQLPYLFQGAGAGVVGEVQRIDPPVRRRDEVEARSG
jgi:hypothetical protein